MRYKQYINEESDDIQGFNDDIHRFCKPYLKLLKSVNGNPLYRGMTIPDNQGVKQVRQDRKNKGYLESDMAKKFNDLLELEDHNRRDNSVMCTSDKAWAEGFGMKVYYIFPIGNISYTWVESKDFNRDNISTGWFYNLPRKHIKGQAYDLHKPLFDYFHTDQSFNVAYDNGYELWFKCRSYMYMKDSDDIVWDNKYQVIV